MLSCLEEAPHLFELLVCREVDVLGVVLGNMTVANIIACQWCIDCVADHFYKSLDYDAYGR